MSLSISRNDPTLTRPPSWGEPFLQETYFYHVHRLDHRHNFSSAFYPISLSASANPLSNFIPQLILTFTIGALFSQDLPLAWFLQTAVFVTFNKVCTSQVSGIYFHFDMAVALTVAPSQYFLWYLWLLPLIVDRLHMPRREAIALAALWVLGQVRVPSLSAR